MKPINHIQNILTKIKVKINNQNMKNLMYTIHCLNCKKSYIVYTTDIKTTMCSQINLKPKP